MNARARDSFLWIAIGDIHDDLRLLERIPELEEADGLIITGDITNLGGEAEARRVLDAARRHLPLAAAQFGNMDKAEVSDYLTREGINIHAAARPLAPGLAVMGAGASTPTPFSTPSEFPETQYAEWLEKAGHEAEAVAPLTVLVSHNPPKNTLCDLAGGSVHVGSEAVRSFLEKYRPALCLCGHIHESRAVDSVGPTRVLNPGNFAAGGYVAVRFANGRVSADLRIL
jgi:Icc-related predicted phosphoesterase